MNKDIKVEAQREYEDLPLTLQIMHELKMSSQRWFIIAMAELVAIILMLFFIFVIPVETSTTYTQDVEDLDSSTVTQTIGD